MAEATRLNALTADVTNEARARVAQLEELDEVTADLLAIMESNPNSMSRLRHRLKRARDAGADESILRQGDDAVLVLKQRKSDARHEMKKLVKEGTDADELEAVTDLAERLHSTSSKNIAAARARVAELRAR